MLSTHQARQRGFTLIELVVVIVIIGILAAFAIPRFANISTEARVAQLRGLAGTLRSTSALVHGIALARNVSNGTITMEGFTIPIIFSYAGVGTTLGPPTADGIALAISNLDTSAYQATYTATTVRFEVISASTPANCSVTYTQAASAVAPATVSVTTETGC